MPIIECDGERKLWGVPLFANIDPDGWIMGEIHNTYEEAEEAANNSPFRVRTIRIQ